MGEPNIEVTALCDVDSQMLRAAADEVEKRTKRRPATFADFRTIQVVMRTERWAGGYLLIAWVASLPAIFPNALTRSSRAVGAAAWSICSIGPT